MRHLVRLSCFLFALHTLHAQAPQYFLQQLGCQSALTQCFDASGNIWIGCMRNDQPLLLQMSPDGTLLQQVPIYTAAGSKNELSEIIADSEGMIVGCGSSAPINPNDPESSFAFRYDPAAGQVLWSRKIVHGYLFLSGIVENGPGGHYWAYGYNYGFSDIADLMLLDRNTGELLPDYKRSFKIGNSEDIRAACYHQGKLYTTGNNDLSYLYGITIRRYLRQNLSCFDTSATPVWNLLGSVPITRRSRLVGQDLIVSGDALVSVFGGNDQSNQSSSSHIFLQKTALDGTLLWVKKYNIPDIATETPMGVVALPDGYVILANSGTLIRTDLEGKVYWGQQIKDFLPAAPVYSKSQNQIMSDGQALYLAGTLPAPLSETYGAWVKVDLNGNISGCPKLLPRTVLELSMDSSFYERRVLQQSDASISSPSAVANTPASAPMKISVLCQNAGPAPENPCEPITSVQHWGDASQPNAITLLRPASDTTLYAAGRLGDRLLLAKLAADGSPLWMKTMPGPDSLTITDLIRDSEGWMVACGHRADPLRGRLAFAFRYQPDTDSLNWWQELGAPVEDGGTLIEIASGLMNYQLCHNVRKPDGRLVSQVVVLSRSTGVVQTAGGRNYDPLSRSQTFSAGAIGEQDRYFVIGRGSSQAGRSRVLLGSLIPSYGGVAWLQLGHKDTLVPGVFAQHSTLLYDQGHIIALYTGHPDATAQTDPTRLYLRKVSPLGAGIWLREYDVAITGDLFMEKTAGGYVICARLGPNRHLMMRTDFNGNLLVVKQISLGGVVGNGSSLGHLQHRIAVLGDYVYFAFYNEHTQQAVLVKTNLNLEVQGNCSGITPYSIASSNDIPSIKNATILQGIFVLTPTGTPLLPAWQPDSVATVRVCPPVIVPPTLQPIPDRSICPGRSTILQASPGFASYTWSDGSTASSLSTNAEGSYWIDARDVCGRSQYDTVVVTVLPNPTKSVILTLNAGSSVVLGGEFYYAPDTVTVPEPSLSGGCDTLTTYYLNLCESKTAQDTLRFYPGQKVTLGGNVYSQPGQVVLYLATAEGCDSTVTYTLEWIKAQVDISCPADTVLATLPGAPWRIVEYPLPTYTTDCPDPDVALVLLEGRYVADTFPLGPTRVCYYAFTTCGVRDTCCFTVRVLPTPSQLGIACPLNQTVTAALGEASAAVSYPLPLVSTDCYDSTAVFDLLSGLPSGADFPIGTTAVCYAAANRCGNRDSCCFSVEVLPAPAFLQVTCPPNRILSASPGGTATLHYPRPGVETDCPDTTVILTLLQGLPSGADFPVGLTAVCYEAANRCGIRDTCCFTVQVLPPPTLLRLSCPANLTVTASATGTATVSYLLPTAVTDCPDPALAYALLQGLPSGSAFPVGTTPVCYEATNRCGIHDTCCFQIQVQTPSAEPPCDVKSPPGCMRFELLSVRLDSIGQRRLRVRVVNTCTSPLRWVYAQLPNGVVAASPAHLSTYTAATGNTYAVRNPNASPFYSVRFQALVGQVASGSAEVFEYVLPQQASPAYLRIAARLADGSYSEALLSVLACPLQPYVNMASRPGISRPAAATGLTDLVVWPSPTAGRVQVQWAGWPDVPMELELLTTQGQSVGRWEVQPGTQPLELDLPQHLPSGLYYLRAASMGPASPLRALGRVVLER